LDILLWLILADETYINLPEEDIYIICIATATSVLPRIAWGLIGSYSAIKNPTSGTVIFDIVGRD
jgi:hypothetical protein